MAIQDRLGNTAPQRVYLFPSADSAIRSTSGFQTLPQTTALYFQYWPGSLQDDYQVEYAEHSIPGGSHPLYQWVAGRGRTISFEAIFTSELQDPTNGALAVATAVGTSLLPSSDFTVNVSAALAKIRSWMMPLYKSGGRLGDTEPPQILTLAFPGTNLGGTTDMIQVILRSAPITIESWFPSGQIRVATVTLTFNEIVQSSGGSGESSSTRVQFIGRDVFETEANKYKFRGLSDKPFIG